MRAHLMCSHLLNKAKTGVHEHVGVGLQKRGEEVGRL